MIISGKVIAEQIQHEIKQRVQAYPAHAKVSLAVVLVGSHPASQTYVSIKEKICREVGIHSQLHHYPENVSEEKLLSVIDELNGNPSIHGILVQNPLPSHINLWKVMEAMDPQKDVDGFHPLNFGRLLLGIPGGFIPCTPLGISVLLERSGIEVAKKHVVILGRSHTVGKPLAALLVQKNPQANATVTIAHSLTKDIPSITQSADILVAAIGFPHFVKESMVKEGAVVIDVGINRMEDPSSPRGYKLVGDVDFDSVKHKCSAITPVPKGVGPMTVAMLLQNTLQSFESQTFK